MATFNGNVNDTSGYTEAFFNAYKPGYEHVLQETTDVYAGVVRNEAIEGERKSYDFLGAIEMSEKTSRFGDIPVDDLDHNRRWIYPKWFEKGVYVDDLDKIALLTDPTGDYMKAIAKGIIRKKNDTVYAAFKGSVQGGKDYGSDTYAFNNTAFSSASQGGRTIVHDTTDSFADGGTSSGLTIEKLILAREALVDLKNDANQIFNYACAQRQISDLIREAETQSIDTSPFKSLERGNVAEFMGFRLMVDYNIVKPSAGTHNGVDGSTYVYENFAFTGDAILYAQHTAPIFKVDWIPTKGIWMVSAKCGMNAIRMDEDKVIKIECV